MWSRIQFGLHGKHGKGWYSKALNNGTPPVAWTPNYEYPPSPDPKNVEKPKENHKKHTSSIPQGRGAPLGARPKAAPMLEVCFL